MTGARPERLLGAARLAPTGPPFGRSAPQRGVVELGSLSVASSNRDLWAIRVEKRFWDRLKLVRPERFELPTSWFVARRSIQLSYGRTFHKHLAEREGFEPSMGF